MRTIWSLWQNALAENRSNPAYLVEEDGGWREVSQHEAATAVAELAHGLLALGVEKGDSFGILARTRLEWVLLDFALAQIGAVAAPIYPSSTASEASYILEHANVVGCLAEDDEQLAKIEAARPEHAYTLETLDELRALGREHASAHPNALDEARAQIGDDDLFTFIYTSGTTGPPKACMILNRNYYEMVGTIDQIENFFLPTVPRVLEKVHTAVTANFAAATGVKRRLIDWALDVGRQVSLLRQRREPVPRSLALEHRIADRLVYSKVKKRLGGRLRAAISGGAPLAKEIAEFFHTLDILILEGYGQTEETTASNVNRPNNFKFGTVGPALPGIEVATAEDGEILIKGPTVFAGYYNDEEATRAVLPGDGWLHTGDVGAIDEDGFLTVTDRKKDIIVTAGGKNLSPQNIENLLKGIPWVSQALVVGDRRPYVAALITLDEEEVAKLEGDEDVTELVRRAVDEINENLAHFEQVRRYEILDRDFSPEQNEVTPTLKLKRRVVEQNFASELERLYTD